MTFVAWVWFGMILGVSFLAAPVKFQVESLSLPIALEVGRATFGVFDRLEWLFSAALAAVTWRRLEAGHLDRLSLTLVASILAIVVIQSAWFLPALDARVDIYVSGGTPPPSALHLVSAIAEGLQALALAWLGFRALAPSSRPA